MVKHGLLMETSEAPRIFSWSFDKTFKRWKLNHQTQPLMMLAASFAGMRGTKVYGFILSNAASLANTLADDRYKQNRRKLEIVPSIRRYGEQRRLTSLVPFGKVLCRARHLGGRYASNGSNKAEYDTGDGGELVGTSGLLVRALAMES